MASLKDMKEFIADLESRDPEGRTITHVDIADLGQSLAKVGGCMSFNEASAVQVTNPLWNRIDGWERSIDTQGVQDGLDEVPPEGWYKVNRPAAGDYTVSCALRFTVDTDGDYEIRIAVADDQAVPDTWESSNTPYHDQTSLLAGQEGTLNISGAVIKGVSEDFVQRLQIEYRGPNGSEITPVFGTFSVQR